MSFNWWTFLFEVLNFVVLAYVLHRLLYRPLREAIDRRRQANASAQEAADKARRDAESLQQQLREQLATAQQLGKELVREAREQAESERRKLRAEAEQAAQRRRHEAAETLERERAEALTALQQEVVGQAIDLTRRLLGEAADRTLHQQLVLRLLDTLQQLPDAERTHLRADWQSGDGPVLESAQELDARTVAALNDAVAAIVNQPVTVVLKSRPDLLGGVRLQLAGHVWDSSLAGQVADR